jgi:fumarate reductase subunit C
MNVRLYVWQRLTAAIMVPLILVHVAVIFYATRRGLTAADVLARTRGSIVWALFYGTFVLAASVHAGVGLRNVLAEWTPLSDRAAAQWAAGIGFLLGVLGVRAIVAVVMP